MQFFLKMNIDAQEKKLPVGWWAQAVDTAKKRPCQFIQIGFLLRRQYLEISLSHIIIEFTNLCSTQEIYIEES